MDDNNPYAKLAEAFRVYLNPNLNLILEGYDLSKHCYFHLHKYPSHQAGIWKLIDQNVQNNFVKVDWLELIKSVEEENQKENGSISKKLVDWEKLTHNLKLAAEKNDQSYLDFLSQHQPKQRFQLNLLRKKAIVEPEIALKLGLIDEDEAKKLTIVQLKMLIHRYVKTKKLQEEDMVSLDSTLKELLFLPNDQEQIHYYDLLKQFNQRYVQKFDDSSSESSSNGTL